MWTELKEGLRFVLGNPNLRAQAGCTATSNLFSSVAFAIILVFAVRELDLSPGLIGVVFSAGAAGSLAAALTATRISRRFGIGPTSIVVAALFGPTMLLVAFAPVGNAAIPFLIAAMLVFGYTVVVYNIAQVSYRQAICPPRLQGRMNSVMRFIVWGTIPIGTLLGGALATWIGFRPTIVVAADRRRPRSALPLLLTPTAPPRPTGASRRHSRRARSRLTFRRMPELPEVEAWVRELDPLVSRAPVEKAGPAHIATLKTFDPPLAALDGRRFEGSRRRGKNLLFPVEGNDLVLRVHLMSAGRLRYLAPGAKGPKTPMFRTRFTDGGELVLTEAGKKKRAGVWLVTPAQLDEDLGHLGPDALDLDAAGLAEILGRERRQLHPLLRDQRALAGIGRAHANEILLRARLSPFKASTELSTEEIERLRRPCTTT